MTAILPVHVVGVVLCVILSSEASDALQCTGEKQSDGHFFFNISYEAKKETSDCETQWLVDEKVSGYSDAEEPMKFESPIVSATKNKAILMICPKKLECLIICPSASIHEKKQCPCEGTPPSTLSKVRSFNWKIAIGIGSAFAVLVIVIVTIVLYCRRTGCAISETGPV